MAGDEKRPGGRGLIPWRLPLPNPLAWRRRIFGRGRKPTFTHVASASVATLTPLSEAVLPVVQQQASGATTTQIKISASATQQQQQQQAQAAAAAAQQGQAQGQQQSGSRVPLKPASDVLAGALARAASQSTIHPLDTLKVRLQTAKRAVPAPAAAPASGLSKFGQLVPPPVTGAAAPALVPAPRFDPRAALMTVGSLYKGLVGAASGAGIAIGAYFAFYGAACNTLSRHTDLAPSAVAFVSGGAAALGSSVVKVPLAVCIRSVQAGVYPNVFNAASSIVKAAGVRGLFTGFAPTVLEDVPDMAIKFAVYEAMRQLHGQLRGPGTKPSPHEDFAMGAIAGAMAAAATTPLDVIKTNMMCAAASRPSMGQAASMVMAQGGPKAFFRGVGTRALSNGINSAVFFCFFETIRGAFSAQQKAKAAAAQERRAAAREGARHPGSYALAAVGGPRGSQLVLANAAAAARAQHLLAAPAKPFQWKN